MRVSAAGILTLICIGSIVESRQVPLEGFNGRIRGKRALEVAGLEGTIENPPYETATTATTGQNISDPTPNETVVNPPPEVSATIISEPKPKAQETNIAEITSVASVMGSTIETPIKTRDNAQSVVDPPFEMSATTLSQLTMTPEVKPAEITSEAPVADPSTDAPSNVISNVHSVVDPPIEIYATSLSKPTVKAPEGNPIETATQAQVAETTYVAPSKSTNNIQIDATATAETVNSTTELVEQQANSATEAPVNTTTKSVVNSLGDPLAVSPEGKDNQTSLAEVTVSEATNTVSKGSINTKSPAPKSEKMTKQQKAAIRKAKKAARKAKKERNITAKKVETAETKLRKAHRKAKAEARKAAREAARKLRKEKRKERKAKLAKKLAERKAKREAKKSKKGAKRRAKRKARKAKRALRRFKRFRRN